MDAKMMARGLGLMVPLMLAVVAGCSKQKAAEEPDTSEEVKEAGEAVEQEAEGAADSAREGADEAAEDVKDATDGDASTNPD
jgi:cobalamin biosynthesis protein CobT